MQEFNEAIFKTKVDNIFVKLFTAIMKGNLTEVDHFISDNVYNKYNEYSEINNMNYETAKKILDNINFDNVSIIKTVK